MSTNVDKPSGEIASLAESDAALANSNLQSTDRNKTNNKYFPTAVKSFMQFYKRSETKEVDVDQLLFKLPPVTSASLEAQKKELEKQREARDEEDKRLRRSKSLSEISISPEAETIKPSLQRSKSTSALSDMEDFPMRPGAKKTPSLSAEEMDDPVARARYKKEIKEAHQEERKRLQELRNKNSKLKAVIQAAIFVKNRKSETAKRENIAEEKWGYQLSRINSLPNINPVPQRPIFKRTNSAPAELPSQLTNAAEIKPPVAPFSVRTDNVAPATVPPPVSPARTMSGLKNQVSFNESGANKTVGAEQHQEVNSEKIDNPEANKNIGLTEVDSVSTNGIIGRFNKFFGTVTSLITTRLAPQIPSIVQHQSQKIDEPKSAKDKIGELEAPLSPKQEQPQIEKSPSIHKPKPDFPPKPFDDFDPAHANHRFAVGGTSIQPLLKSVEDVKVRYKLSSDNQKVLGISAKDIGKVIVTLAKGVTGKYDKATKTDIANQTKETRVQEHGNDQPHSRGR